MSFSLNDSMNQDDEQDTAETWWRPLLLLSAIGAVIAVHWWILS